MAIDKKQIYIVDDDESVGCGLKSLLMTFGFSVRTFSSAEEFFSAVPNSTPGCLILDIHLPGLDGWEAQRRLFKSGSQRPIIIISADKDCRLKDQAVNVGAVGFLYKPFDGRELVDLINLTFDPNECERRPVAFAGKS